MESLQPHPNLKELGIWRYRGITFPKWIGNPTSCAMLEKLDIFFCENLTFLPFSSLLQVSCPSHVSVPPSRLSD